MAGPPKLPKKKSKFRIAPWLGENEGDKVIVSGISGIGKTTLCSLLPNNVFIGVDDGGRKMKHPVTGKPLQYIKGIENFEDVRNALRTKELFANYDNIIIDNVTELERWALPYIFERVKAKRNKTFITAKNIKDYGYHEGYTHWHDAMRLILQDCDGLIRQGKNIIMVAQSTIGRFVQAGAEDFVKEGPALYHDKSISTMNMYIEWADHVFRIAHSNITVDEQKKASGTTARAVYTHPEPHFYAKSRGGIIPEEYSVVAFEKPQDDSIWRVLFGDK